MISGTSEMLRKQRYTSVIFFALSLALPSPLIALDDWLVDNLSIVIVGKDGGVKVKAKFTPATVRRLVPAALLRQYGPVGVLCHSPQEVEARCTRYARSSAVFRKTE